MTWFPLGPRFVFYPNIPEFARLSRTNEQGCQAQANRLATDPRDRRVLYVAERPWSGGADAFRTMDGGCSWEPISDGLIRQDPTIDPYSFAINSFDPNHICMSAFDHRSVFTSFDRGRTWEPRAALPGTPFEIVMDQRRNTDPRTTHVYAATDNGLFLSTDGGRHFATTAVLDGEYWTLVFGYDGAGIHAYAGRAHRGVYYSTDPSTPGSWQNLNDLNIGLPAHVDNPTPDLEGTFRHVLVDICPSRPTRAYAFLTLQKTDGSLLGQGIYTTADPRHSWTLVHSSFQPTNGGHFGPSQYTVCMRFKVAPNSPGDGVEDVLMFAGQGIFRSTDGGVHWESDQHGFHVDQHDFAFAPPWPPAGVIPVTYEASDGGVCASTRFADPTYVITDHPTSRNESAGGQVQGLWENVNHGKQSLALYSATALAGSPTVLYATCQDTELVAGGGNRGWRGFSQGDGGGAIAAAQRQDGVVFWRQWGILIGWPGIRFAVAVDGGGFSCAAADCRTANGDSRVEITANAVALSDATCLAGGNIGEALTTLVDPIPSAGRFSVRVASPAAIGVLHTDGEAIIDTRSDIAEYVGVESAAGGRLTATFVSAHPAGQKVLRQACGVLKVDQQGVATRVSQVFGSYNKNRPARVAIARHDDRHALALTVLNNNDATMALWRKPHGPYVANETWTKVDQNQPAGAVSDVAITPTDVEYVLLRSTATTEVGSTPLFRIVGRDWRPVACVGLPAGDDFRNLVAHSRNGSLLYASKGDRVFEVSVTGDSGTWRDVSDALPGSMIQALWLDEVDGDAERKILLRAGLRNRGLWECDVTTGATTSAGVSLYVRDNFVDDGRLAVTPVRENPYDPSQMLTWFDCADIKLDARQHADGSGVDFYQTGSYIQPFPIDDTVFEELADRSASVPNQPANVIHVQVHNRSHQAADNVWVWAVYCPTSVTLPALSTSPSFGDAFPFWQQFTATGIQPDLPADSPWRSAGPPVALQGIDASHPRVASWFLGFPVTQELWRDYTIVAFVHSAAGPINESRMVVEDIVATNKQIGARNVSVYSHIVPPVAPHSTWRSQFYIRWPIPRDAVTTIEIDTSRLPKGAGLMAAMPVSARPKRFAGGRYLGSANHPADGLPHLAADVVNGFRSLVGLAPGTQPVAKDAHVYAADAGADLRLENVPMSARSEIKLDVAVRLATDTAGSIEVRQHTNGKQTGRLVLRIPAGDRAPDAHGSKIDKMVKPPNWTDRDWMLFKIAQRRRRYVAPWVRTDQEARWREAIPELGNAEHHLEHPNP